MGGGEAEEQRMYKGSSTILISVYVQYLFTLKHYSLCCTITVLTRSEDLHIHNLILLFGWTVMSQRGL